MTVVRLELDVPEVQAAGLADALMREYADPGRPGRGWTATRVTVLSDFEVQRERTLLTAAQYFYPPPPGAGHGS